MLDLKSLFGGGRRRPQGAVPPPFHFDLPTVDRTYRIWVDGDDQAHARRVLVAACEVFAREAGRAALPAPKAASPAREAPPAPARVEGAAPRPKPLTRVSAAAAAADFDRHCRQSGLTGLQTVQALDQAYRKRCRAERVHALPWSVLAQELRTLWGNSSRRRCGNDRKVTCYHVPPLAVVPLRRAA